MAKNKIGLQFTGWEELIADLDELGGMKAVKRGVEAGLKASKEYVNPQIYKVMAKPNLPAGGEYSSEEETKHSVDTDMHVDWQGITGSIEIGFDFEKSGLKSIFLMYGTPKMSPVPGLKNAIYGIRTKRKIAQLQSEALNRVIKRIMEGK